MHQNCKLSRRSIVAGLAVAPTFSTTIVDAKMNLPDAKLVALCQESESVSAALERTTTADEVDAIFARQDVVCDTIALTPANTLQGLCAKARSTAWALEWEIGSFDPMKEASIHDRIVASIVQDLLRLSGRNS